MKKIIGWFKNILMRILEVVNYMIKKDNEIELAKLEFKKELTTSILTDRNVRHVLGCVIITLGVGISIVGAGVLYTAHHDLNTPQNILAN